MYIYIYMRKYIVCSLNSFCVEITVWKPSSQCEEFLKCELKTKQKKQQQPEIYI